MRQYPAIEIHTAVSDELLAAIDDFEPTAVEERESSTRVFFATAAARDRACHALAPRFPVDAVDVADDDWARRSQENLQPVTVGRITIAPPWATREWSARVQPGAASDRHADIQIVIEPSMGFGTGHHATTRLCLAAMQTIDLADTFVLDVGTGSGVLALAAGRLGAARAIGIDNDPDAIQSARENLERNPEARHVLFEIADLTAKPLPPVDVVTANLTGVLLVGTAQVLAGAIRAGGMLVVSGLLAHERDEVVQACAPLDVVWELEEDGWVGIAMKKR